LRKPASAMSIAYVNTPWRKSAMQTEDRHVTHDPLAVWLNLLLLLDYWLGLLRCGRLTGLRRGAGRRRGRRSARWLGTQFHRRALYR
jgi:hypothetical protein